MVPTVELPPVVPLTCHLTLVSDVFFTVAVNWRVRRRRTTVLAGDTETVTAMFGDTVTETGADACPSGFARVTE
jgi:hypothetical protein